MDNCPKCKNTTVLRNPLRCDECRQFVCRGCYGFSPNSLHIESSRRILCMNCEIQNQNDRIHQKYPSQREAKMETLVDYLDYRLELETENNLAENAQSLIFEKEIQDLEKKLMEKENTCGNNKNGPNREGNSNQNATEIPNNE